MYTSCVDSAKLQSSSSVLDGALEEGYKLNRSVNDLASQLDSCDNNFDNCFASIVGELEGFEEDIAVVPNCVSNLRDLLGGALYAYGIAENGNIDVSLISDSFKDIYDGEVLKLKNPHTLAYSTDEFITNMDKEVKDYISENVLNQSLDDLPYSVRNKYRSSMEWYNDLRKKYISNGYTEREAELLAKKEMVRERLGETNSLVVDYAESKYDQDYSKYGEVSNKDYIAAKEKYQHKYGLSEEAAGKLARAECEAKDAAIDMQSDDYSKTEMQKKIDNYKSLLKEYNISNETVSKTVDTSSESAVEAKSETDANTGSSSTSGSVSYRYDSSVQNTNSNTGTVNNTVNTDTTVVDKTEVLDTNVDNTTPNTVVDNIDNNESKPITDIIDDSPSNPLPNDNVTNNNTVVETPSTPVDTNNNTYTPGNNTTPTYNYNNNYTPNTSVPDSSNVEVTPSTSDTPSISTDHSSVAGSIAGAVSGSTGRGSVVSKIPTSSEPIKSSSSGAGSNVIPIIAGVGAAAAAGIGAKVYLDRKHNNDNTDSYDGSTSSGIAAEDWSDQNNLSIDYDDNNQENEYLDSTDDYSYVTEDVEKYSAKDSSDLAEQQL